MNSEQRHQARYERRKAKREAKKNDFKVPYNDYDEVFTYEHLYNAYKKCKCNVTWKASVQRYIAQAPLYVYQTYMELKEGTFKSDGFFEFDIMERGKERHIKSVTIKERVVQRCLCDYALVPMLSRKLIYDNGACLKDKGYAFASNRVLKHLRKFYYEYKQDGYVLLFDFSKFFDNIDHNVIKKILRNEFTDERIIKLTEYFIDAFGDIGVGLGSQISQIFALSTANRLDHYIKEKLKIKYFGRYMDDGYLIHHSKEYLEYCLTEIQRICSELGIKLNLKKTHIVKLSHCFTFLKIRYYLFPNGRIIRKLARSSITRMRRKLKKLHKKQLPYFDIYQSFQSWCSYATKFNSYVSVCYLKFLFLQLYGNQALTLPK